jgi:hypothetical protein
MPIVLNGTTGITTPTYNGNTTAEYLVPVTGFKNRIINGAMVIDQRNAGASISFAASPERKYTVDRWSFVYFQDSKFTGQQNLNSITPPAGFSNYFGLQTAATFTVGVTEVFSLSQIIEGFNAADLNWGTANAKTVTLSFWVRSSLTGTFGGSFMNAATNRSYPYTYTISSADTWEYKTVTVAGDTSGTWLTTNGAGIRVDFSLATGSVYSGTAGAWVGAERYSATGAVTFGSATSQTFYITGVQLEVGSTATSFDYRPYTTELQLCQRYFQTYGYGIGTPNDAPLGTGYYFTSTEAIVLAYFSVTMRTKPTYSSATVTNGYRYSRAGASTTINSLPYYGTGSQSIAQFGDINLPVAGSAGNAVTIVTEVAGARVNFSAEL